MESTDNKPTLSKLEVVRAATNDPALSTRVVMLGDREFPIVDLKYDHYVLFLAQLHPLLQGLLSTMFMKIGGGDVLTPASLLTYCGASLPEMARIVCAQTDPDITIEEVKALGGTPFNLAKLVLAQVEQNHIINDIKDFFVQVAPLLKATMK